MRSDALLGEFVAQRPTLQNLRQHVEAQLSAALSSSSLPVPFVSGRVKEEASLRRKLARPDKTYAALWDVTDLVGVRDVTYFEDTVDDVARIIEDAYAVDFAHSGDRQHFIDKGRFGYRSLHDVCAAPKGHWALPKTFRFEVQVPVLDAYNPLVVPLDAVYPERSHLRAAVTAFIDFVSERLGEPPVDHSAP